MLQHALLQTSNEEFVLQSVSSVQTVRWLLVFKSRPQFRKS